MFEKFRAISKVSFLYSLLGLAIFIMFKLFIFYVPFLIGFIIAQILEPIIIKMKNKTHFTRKTCSIIVLVIFFTICISIIALGSMYLVSEMTELLSGLNEYIEIIINKVQDLNKMFNFEDLKIGKDLKTLLENATFSFINDVGKMIKNNLTGFIKLIGKLPNFFVYLVITILSTYFIASDKFYILDRMEYHFPKKWIGKAREKTRKIKSSLGSYLKAEIIMILISFVIVLIGLYIFHFIGLNVPYPLLMAVIIGFVDALPILGGGTVLVPWAIIGFINNDISLASALLALYIFTLLAKQFLEPKIVSNKIGIHPIFTLIAMYTGFKFLGLIGLLAGPIILIILQNIFSNTIDKGLVNSVLDLF